MTDEATHKINVLLKLGKHGAYEDLPEGINLDALRNEGYRHLSWDWSPWRDFLDGAKTEKLLNCMRGIVILERLLQARNGSTTVLPKFFQEVERRYRLERSPHRDIITNTFNWVLSHSENGYLPNGSGHNWHGNYHDYFEWRKDVERHNSEKLHRDYIDGLKRRTERRERNLQRQEKQRAHSNDFRAFIQTLNSEQYCIKMETGNKPPEFFFPDIQSRMENDDFSRSQLERILKLIQTRSTEGRNKRAKQMMTCIQNRIEGMEK